MSTPPFVTLPEGVAVERWPVSGTERAVMRTELAADAAWMLLVPGFTGSKEDFIAVLPLLADRGIGGVTYDQFGQFESDGSADPADYTIERLAVDLRALVEVARARFALTAAPILVGHSFGGLVAQRAVVDGLDVAEFVALCTGPGALPPHRHGGLNDLVEALPHTDLEVIWNIMQAQAEQARQVPGDPQVRDFLRRRWLANHPVQIREFGHQLMTAPPVTGRMRARLADGLPARVMWGEHDDAWPIDLQAQMAADWGVPGIALPDVGHSPNAERPVELVAALLGR